MFNGSTILVTGGTGSFGVQFIKNILEYPIKKLIIFSRDELKQLNIRQQYNDSRLRFFIGDVRDKDRLLRAFEGVDYIVHTAALKQIDTAEYNPFEYIKTNVIGAQNVIEASIDRGVKKVIALSTDKANQAINLYGATKLCSDKLFIAGNSYTGSKETKFSVVRYGNVMNSRGSVIPLFLEQKKTGVLKITNPEMTRFWITLQEAVNFVINNFQRMQGGEIFIPKIPSMKVIDLARTIAPGCKIEYIGIRPGEKLHESMISIDDSRNVIEFEDYYIIEPQFKWWNSEVYIRENKYSRPKANFSYTSKNNKWFLVVPEIKELLKKVI